VLLISGTASVAHLRENLTAEGAMLDDEAGTLDGVGARQPQGNTKPPHRTQLASAIGFSSVRGHALHRILAMRFHLPAFNDRFTDPAPALRRIGILELLRLRPAFNRVKEGGLR
jgi:hypothetical protein